MNWEIKNYYDEYSSSNPDFYIARQTLREIVLYCDNGGVTFVSNSTIANNTKQSMRTISRHIKILEDIGIIETIKKGGTSTAIRRVKIDIDMTSKCQADDKQVPKDRHSIDKQVPSMVSNEEKVIEEKVIEEPNATQQVATLKQKKTKILNDEQNESFEYIWKNYELETLVKEVGRNAESKTDVKKIYTKLVIDNKINYKLVEDYIADLYSNAIDINFLLGLRKIFNDVETFKELQMGQDENK